MGEEIRKRESGKIGAYPIRKEEKDKIQKEEKRFAKLEFGRFRI